LVFSEEDDICLPIILSSKIKVAQRFALPACGRVWILFGSRKKLEARKLLENGAESPASGAGLFRSLTIKLHHCLYAHCST